MQDFLLDLGIKEVNSGASTGTEKGWLKTTGEKITSYSPIDGKPIASIIQATKVEYEHVIKTAQKAFCVWKEIPAPQRGNIVREIGNALRDYKDPLGKLVTLEMGKILQEGLGEVQEMIDIADFSLF